MSKNTRSLEDVKVDIHAILVPAQNGLTLHKLLQDYKGLIGQPIPFREFGYQNPVDFMKSIPDVVHLTWLPELNDYLLNAVGNEKTKHIEKMVSKQKPSKTSLPVSRRRRVQVTQVNRYLQSSINTSASSCTRITRSQRSNDVAPRSQRSNDVAPRFQKTKAARMPFVPADVKQEINQLLREYTEGISHQNFLFAYKRRFGKELKYQDMGFCTLYECLGTVPGLQFSMVNGDKRVFIPGVNKPISKASAFEAPDKKSGATHYSEGSQKSIEKVPLLEAPIPEAKSGSTHYSQRTYVASASQKTVEKAPLLDAPNLKFHDTREKQRVFFFQGNQIPSQSTPQLEARYYDDSWKMKPPQKFTPASHSRSSFSAASETSEYHQSDTLDDIEAIDESYDDQSGISEAMKRNFRKILQMNPHGIWAADFPKSYEELTGYKFSLNELGYFSLVELTNALPDIFKRVRPAECKSDWLLFDANAAEVPFTPSPNTVETVSESGLAYIDEVVSNIRKILEGNSEGVFLDDVIHLYTLNCESPLILHELGFSSIEKFLLKIADRVPLKFDYSSTRKKVRLGYCASPVFVHPDVSRRNFKGKVVPKDAILPGLQYELQVIPSLSDPSGYIPITTGTIVDPDHLWIQLVGDDTSDALYDLMEKLEYFYNSPDGDNYTMLDCHIIVGSIAAGIWAGDAGWHRISITGLPSDSDFVDASFVDYGTRAKVKKADLRYLKKEYLSLPAQAIKAYMAFVRPVEGAWNEKTHNWLMKHLRNKTVMAEIVKTANVGEPVCVWLCDCSSDDDKFLNLMLADDGLAIYCTEDAAETMEANISKKPLSFHEKLSHYGQASSFSAPSAAHANTLPRSAAHANTLPPSAAHANTLPPQAAPQGVVTPADVVKVLSTLSQLQSTSPFNSQLLLEWILRLANPSGNVGGGVAPPVNTPLLQQLLGNGMDLPTVVKLLASVANNHPENNPISSTQQNMSNFAYVPPYNANSFQQSATSSFPSTYGNASFLNSASAGPSTVKRDLLSPSNKPAAAVGPLSDFTRHTGLPEASCTPIPPPSNNPYIQPPRSNGNQAEVPQYVSPSDSDSDEIFHDDDEDEENLEELYNQYGIRRKRFVSRVILKDGYRFHTVVVESVPYVSCGDVSHLLWSNEDSDCLSRRLRGKDIAFSTFTIYDTDYPEVFHQLRCCKVNGIKESDKRSAIILFKLENVIDILNIFGHPSKTIRAEIARESSKFNLADELWQNFSGLDISDEEDSAGTTDSDKFKRMCIFDLKATLEGLRFKRLKIMSGLTKAKDIDPKDIQEVRKIEEQFQVYQKRIKEIEAVCES